MLANRKECCGCGACASICPKKCIVMKTDNEGFLQPLVDESVCVQCGMCEKDCPVINKSAADKNLIKKVYAAVINDDDIRHNSSSGGVFTAVAEQVLREGGIVFGAAMAEGCRKVRHIEVDTIEKLQQLRGSKYVQSEIGDSYIRTKNHLDEGRRVLFTGTPCQIAGLHSFLGLRYDNLITQDFICHGCPSGFVWEEYVKSIERHYGKNVKQVSFRDKRFGWKDFCMRISFLDGTEYAKKFKEDMFGKGFLLNLYLRNSCHKCFAKGDKRYSDITLADFWGVGQEFAEYSDEGVSLVFVNTDKGKKLINDVSDRIKVKEIVLEKAVGKNPAMYRSAEKHPYRNRFFRELKANGIEYSMERNCKNDILAKINRKLNRWVGK